MVFPSNFLYSILKLTVIMSMYIKVPLFVPSLGRRVQQKSTVPFSLLRVWDTGTQKRSGGFLGPPQSPLNFVQDQAR